jgi:DNA-binding transcriptional ArsR family regulator
MALGQVHFPSREFPVRFVLWPARTLFASQFFVLAGEAFPGMPAWIGKTRERLSPRLLEDLLVVNAFSLVQKVVDEQLLASLHEQDVPVFLEWVAQLDADRLLYLTKAFEPESLRAEPDGSRRLSFGLTDTAASWEGLAVPEECWDRILELRSTAEELQSLLISTLSRFWASHLKPEFDSRGHELRESVTNGTETLAGPITFENLLEGLVGRRRPVDADSSDPVSEILAVPVLHFGPYARSSQVDLDPPIIVVEYEAKRFLERVRAPRGELKASAFRALGDPSRLRIARYLKTGEHYGGEIVEHVGLSQATVSEHLRLLVAEGVVLVRREGNTKYYSLNGQFLSQLEQAIAQLKAPS